MVIHDMYTFIGMGSCWVEKIKFYQCHCQKYAKLKKSYSVNGARAVVEECKSE